MKKSGVSMVVLVITIIVIGIIAGAVVISIGENDLVLNADETVNKHNTEQLEEIILTKLISNGWYEGKILTDSEMESYLWEIEDAQVTKTETGKWQVKMGTAVITVNVDGSME